MVVSEQPRVGKAWSPCGRRENWQDYYTVRPAVSDYAHYWGQVVDPDGRLRQRDTEQERLQYLADTWEEIDYVNQLCALSVLDVGAGLGWFLGAVECEHKAAVEIAPEAQAKLRTQGLQLYGNLADVPSNAFDCIIAHHVIEHIADPAGAINHIRRALHPGGHLVIATPDFGSPCAVRFGKRYRMLHDPTHCSLFTLESMHRFLRDHGFTIHRVSFPFPARYATAETMARWNDTQGVSPPWPGNWMTFFASRT